MKHKDAKIFENHLNPVMLVFIGKLPLSVLSDEYPCARVYSQSYPMNTNMAGFRWSSCASDESSLSIRRVKYTVNVSVIFPMV